MLSFGVLMGFVFPVYANFFVQFKEGMMTYFVIGCILAGITVGIVSFTFVKVILLKPLLAVSKVANDLQNKTISKRIDIQSNDSVGDIIDGLNASGNCIKMFLQQMENATHINNEILGKVKGGSSVEEDSFNTIHTSIESVTEAASSISQHSGEICKTLVQGNNSVYEWQKRLEDVNGYVENLSIVMESLIENAQKINTILEGVEEIARRTNLVSVNASIEATSAGVHGKGFNVVALEIRGLANSVSESAQDIARYINSINSNIQTSASSVSEISGLIDKNRSSSFELKKSFSLIDEVAKSNYRADKQLKGAVGSLNNSFREIENVITSLSENTKMLQKEISAYTY